MIPTPLNVWTSETSGLVFVEILVGNRYVLAVVSTFGKVWEVTV